MPERFDLPERFDGPERFDVIVVGARCAGSPLAAMLARRGLSVALVDRATFPSDTLSTHTFQNDASRVLAGVGVLDRVLASGAPWIELADLRIDDLGLRHRWPRRPGDPGPMLSVRRPFLDTVLVEAAADAGAEVRTGVAVTGLVRDGDRVVGVRVAGAGADGAEHELRARLVVGADGRASTVGRLTGARRYNVVPNQRLAAWAYYEGTSPPEPTTFFVHRWDEEYVVACPCDAGLYLVIVFPPVERAAAFRHDAVAAFEEHVRRCPPVADVVAGGRRVGRPVMAFSWTSYLRESAGAGWVLVGDAGHFKDPGPGQGITDALRQAERLAGHIVTGLDAGGSPDLAMASWWRWRDRDAQEMAWFACDLGRGGTVPAVLVEILRHLAGDPAQVDRWFDVLNHRVRPSQILTPARLAGATSRLLRRGDPPRAEVLRETREIVVQDLRRRWLNRRPAYAPARDG